MSLAKLGFVIKMNNIVRIIGGNNWKPRIMGTPTGHAPWHDLGSWHIIKISIYCEISMCNRQFDVRTASVSILLVAMGRLVTKFAKRRINRWAVIVLEMVTSIGMDYRHRDTAKRTGWYNWKHLVSCWSKYNRKVNIYIFICFYVVMPSASVRPQ